jgi:type IV pilus assembly protein PilO
MEFYAEKPIELKMVGSYHQFGAFVSGVASLPRVVIMTMHDISLKPRENVQGPTPAKNKAPVGIGPNSILELKGTVKTYRYRDEEEAAGAAAAPPAGAPAGTAPAAAPNSPAAQASAVVNQTAQGGSR